MVKHLNRLVRCALSAWFMSLVLFASACPPPIKPLSAYGVTYQNANIAIGATRSIAQVSLDFPRYYQRLKQVGGQNGDAPLTDAEILKLNNYEMAWGEQVWSTTDVAITGTCTSRGNVDSRSLNVRVGVHLPLPFCMGQYWGAGTFMNYIAGDENSTNIYVDQVGWLGVPTRRNAFESTSWGKTGNSSYTESFKLGGFRIIGNAGSWNDPSYTSNGIAVWNAGETSSIDDIYVHNFNDNGLLVCGGTPTSIGMKDGVTAFNNGRSGALLQGTWGSTIRIGELSGDDNGKALLETAPGSGGDGNQQGGGSIFVEQLKNECGVTSEAERGTWKFMNAGYFKGQFSVFIGSVNFTANGVYGHTPFVVDARLENGNLQRSKLVVAAFKGSGFEATLHDLAAKKVYDIDGGSFEAFGFMWNSKAPTPFKEDNDIHFSEATCNSTERLGWFRGAGMFNLTNGTPVFSMTGPGGTTPPPNTCTWTLGAKTCGACSGGTMTCTASYVSTVAWCTPTSTKPPDVMTTEPCTVPPPTSALLTLTNLSNAAVDARQNLNATTGITGVKRAVFTGIKWTKTGSGNYPYLLGISGDNGVQANPSGTIIGWGVTITASGPLVNGSSVDITVTFASPVTAMTLYNRDGSRDAFIGSIAKLELFAQ